MAAMWRTGCSPRILRNYMIAPTIGTKSLTTLKCASATVRTERAGGPGGGGLHGGGAGSVPGGRPHGPHKSGGPLPAGAQGPPGGAGRPQRCAAYTYIVHHRPVDDDWTKLKE